jgi:hypothetical protein
MLRKEHPALWGPISARQLVDRLAISHSRGSDYCSRWGRRCTNQYLDSFQQLAWRLDAGLSLDLTKIKAEAADTARMIQVQGVWADA